MTFSVRILFLVALVSSAAAAQAETVRVLSYNLFHGGDAGKQPRSQTLKVIQAADAPIAALQETMGKGQNKSRPNRGPAIAKALGWHYFDQENNNGVASKYPIVGSSPKKHGVKVQLPSGDALWIFNLHLAPRPYQPHQIYKIPQKNAGFIEDEASAIAAAQEARGHQVAEVLSEIGQVRKARAGIVIVGDFNEPSALDWTKATAAAGKCLFPVAWPTTIELQSAGFIDAYRTVFPDAVRHPGLTWTPILPEDTKQDHHDRIDFIFADSATLEVKNVQLIGERKERADIFVSPYPSDHRALVATLAIKEKPLGIAPINSSTDEVTFQSKSLNTTRSFCVIRPAGFTKDKADWPVLVLLHGRGRSRLSLIDDPATMTALAKAPFVTVLPQGDDGWYIDSPLIKKDKYEQLLSETIQVAEKEYRLSTDRNRRGITGWSMGGFGSAHYAVKHPKAFGFLAPIIGLVDFPRSGLPEGQSYTVPVKRFGTDENVWREFNPIAHAEKLRDTRVFVVAADQAFDRTMNEKFHERLQELKIDHRWKMLRGSHKIEVVYEAVPLVIEEFTSFLNAGKK